VGDSGVALHRGHYLNSAISATCLYRPRQELVHGRSTTGQPMKTRIKILIQQVLRQQRLCLCSNTTTILSISTKWQYLLYNVYSPPELQHCGLYLSKWTIYSRVLLLFFVRFSAQGQVPSTNLSMFSAPCHLF